MPKPSPALLPSAAVTALATLIVVSLSAVAPAQSIRLGGSDTMVPLARALASAYGREHASHKVVVEGLGSEHGLAALQTGELDIAAMSRPLTDAERQALAKQWGAPPLEQVVALDGVGIYLNANNPVSSLRLAELAQILSGEVRNWKELGGSDRRIDVYLPDPASGTRRWLQGRLLEGRRFSSTAVEVATPWDTVAAVTRNLGGIACATIGYAEGTKIVPLVAVGGGPAVWPGQESIAAGTYPLVRTLLLVCDTSKTAVARRFVDWAAGPNGQQVVEATGLKRAPKAAAMDTLVAGNRLPLRPDTEQQLGISMQLQVADGTNATTQRAVTVRLRATTAGRTLPPTLLLKIGDDLEVPLHAVDGEVTFLLRRDWHARAVLLLPQQVDGGAARVLVAALADYLPPK